MRCCILKGILYIIKWKKFVAHKKNKKLIQKLETSENDLAEFKTYVTKYLKYIDSDNLEINKYIFTHVCLIICFY